MDLTRRTVLTLGAAAAAVGSAELLAACTGGSASKPTPTAASPT